MYPQPLNESSAAHVAACVVAAFDQLHPRSILFRGLDANTIAVDRNGLAQLVDFRYGTCFSGYTTLDLCSSHASHWPLHVTNLSTLCCQSRYIKQLKSHQGRAYSMCGNPSYAAPEMSSGKGEAPLYLHSVSGLLSTAQITQVLCVVQVTNMQLTTGAWAFSSISFCVEICPANLDRSWMCQLCRQLISSVLQL